MIKSVILAIFGYAFVYVGMAWNSGYIPAGIWFPKPWRVLIGQLTVFMAANAMFMMLYIRERAMMAGILTLVANVVCMIAATCLMEWRAPNAAFLTGSSLALAGGLIAILGK